MIGQLTANEMFVLVVGAILSFAFQMLGGWILWGMKLEARNRAKELDEIRKANKLLREDLLKLQKSHNDVVIYLKMNNGDIAREVL